MTGPSSEIDGGGGATPTRGRPASGEGVARFARMRHELYTPINHILGFCEILQEDESLPPAFHEDLAAVHAGGKQLLSLSRDYFNEETFRERRPDVHRMYHELRTPVNHIVGYTDLLDELAEDAGRSDARKDLAKIRAAAHAWLHLIEDYLGLRSREPTTQDGPIRAAGDADEDPGSCEQAPANEPRPVPVASTPAGREPASAPRLDGRILVVDDDPANRELLLRRLGREGCEVAAASGGAEALRMLGTGGFDLVLLDLVMPGMNGFEVLERIKREPAWTRLRVIMLSAMDEEASVARCIEAGADDFVVKPFNPVFLRARIAASLEKQRLRDREQEFVRVIERERERSDRLLLNVLPPAVADRLKAGESMIADQYEEATVLFADLVGFTALARELDAMALVEFLNAMFTRFDDLAAAFGLEKIKTIGDAYMLVAGVPESLPRHAEVVVDLALRMRDEVAQVSRQLGRRLEVRIGIHSGPLVAGIIGKSKFSYDLWGDTVNLASRMESSARAGEIQLSEAAFRLVEDSYAFERREGTEIKGVGRQPTYLLVGRRDKTIEA